MNNVASPGVNQKWLKGLSAHISSEKKWLKTKDIEAHEQLEYYVENGVVEDYEPISWPGLPERKSWELGLSLNLGLMSAVCTSKLELEGLAGKAFDSTQALQAFASALTYEMVSASNHTWMGKYRPSLDYRQMNSHNISHTALGVIIGCVDQAFMLARLQIAAMKKNYYLSSGRYPVFFFILRILGDVVGEFGIPLHGDLKDEPIFDALFNNWKSTDLELVRHLCLAACDEHTHRSVYEEGKLREFTQSSFTRIPIEILLLFKLRNRLGLTNPIVDHPLMNAPLGELPEEIKFESISTGNSLISRVRQRMIFDGYDEKKIFADVIQ